MQHNYLYAVLVNIIVYCTERLKCLKEIRCHKFLLFFSVQKGKADVFLHFEFCENKMTIKIT
jgi:hypothetical protein